MRRARFRGDGGEFLFNCGNDLMVDRRCKLVAIRFRCPPPQHVDADCTDHDRCEDETGNREANANSHERLSLLLRAQKAKTADTRCCVGCQITKCASSLQGSKWAVQKRVLG